LFYVERASVHVKFWIFGGFVWVRNASEVLDNSISCLLVKTFNIAGFASLKGGTDVNFSKVKASFLVNLASEVSAGRVGRDECHENDLARHSEQLGYFSNAADVLSSVFIGEAQTLVKASADHITIEDKDLLVVANEGIDFSLEAD